MTIGPEIQPMNVQNKQISLKNHSFTGLDLSDQENPNLPI